MDDRKPEQELAALRERLYGMLYLAYQRGRDSMCGTAGDKDRYYEAAGAGLNYVADDAGKLHEAYTAFLRAQVKAAKEKK